MVAYNSASFKRSYKQNTNVQAEEDISNSYSKSDTGRRNLRNFTIQAEKFEKRIRGVEAMKLNS